MTKIKICGITRPQDVAYLNEALPDYAGFIFVPASRRFIKPEKAAALRRELDERIVTVGVFRDVDARVIAGLVWSHTIGAVQLHGKENAEYIDEVNLLGAPLIRAVRVKDEHSFGDLPADMLLFDNGEGGTGETFGLGLLDKAREAGSLTTKPFFIAGGVDIDNIGAALERNPYGIDVSTGAETKGVKDGKKIHALVRAVREASENKAEKR